MLFTEKNLKNFKITKNGNFYNTLTKKTYYYHYACVNCGYPYLGQNNHGKYCNNRCNPIGDNHPMYGRMHLEESKQKMSKNKSKNNNSNWKGGVTHNKTPLYYTYTHQLEPIEQCNHDKDPNILNVFCVYCGKQFRPTIRQVHNRILGFIKDINKFYCSNECKQQCPIYRRRKFYKGQEGYNSREVQPQLRQLVFARDNWTCQKCGNEESLHCHHINPVISDPIESADVDNCITLCVECHKESHKIAGCGYYELTC